MYHWLNWKTVYSKNDSFLESGLKPAKAYDRFRSNNVNGKYWPPKMIESGLEPTNIYDRYWSSNVDSRYWPTKVEDKHLSIGVEGESIDTSVDSRIPDVSKWFLYCSVQRH